MIETNARLRRRRFRFSEDRFTWRWLMDAAYILAGVGLVAIGLNRFILPVGLLDGGVVGLSLLVNEFVALDFALLFALLSLPFVVTGALLLNRKFALKTILALGALVAVISFLPVRPLTDDRLLAAVFGGVCLGAGGGLIVRGGAVLDGTDVLAVLISRRSVIQFGDLIFLINGLIFLAAAIFIDLERALYSIITYFVAAKLMDVVVNGLDEYVAVNIVTPQSELIRAAITDKLKRGATIFPARRGMPPGGHDVAQSEIEVVLCVVTRFEVQRLKRLVRELDPEAFLYTYRVTDTTGGFLRKRSLERL